MREFVYGTEEQYEDLRDKIQGVCYVFPNITLPPGSSQERCRLGFEYIPQTGYKVYIDKGITNNQNCAGFNAFLALGEKSFEDYDDIKTFFSSLKPLYGDVEKKKEFITSEPCYISTNELFLKIREKIKGQDEAIYRVANDVSLYLAKRNPAAPLSIMLPGPTGVGKTETAKVLAEIINTELIEVELNTYKESHRVSQLLGAPAGYVGHGEKTILTKINTNPRTVVVWNELDKAHPDLLDVLMETMDNGKLPLASEIEGKSAIDCRWCIFVFTTNEPIYNMTSSSDVESLSDALVRAGMRPEIIARFDDIICYDELRGEVLSDIINLQIVKFAKEYDLNIVEINSDITKSLLTNLNSTKYGVRYLKKPIKAMLGQLFSAKNDYGSKKLKLSIRNNNPVLELCSK